jgi:uncharacterized DUF497 family protein
MALTFEWDKQKSVSNLEKHGVTFEEASTVFQDPLSLTISDPLHSLEEQRFATIGESVEREILVVVHTQQERNIRIISAREATRKERRDYEKR